jgi:hypothetical protein
MARKTFKIGDVVTFSTTARPVRYQGRKAVVVETETVGTRTRYALDFGSRKATLVLRRRTSAWRSSRTGESRSNLCS